MFCSVLNERKDDKGGMGGLNSFILFGFSCSLHAVFMKMNALDLLQYKLLFVLGLSSIWPVSFWLGIILWIGLGKMEKVAFGIMPI